MEAAWGFSRSCCGLPPLHPVDGRLPVEFPSGWSSQCGPVIGVSCIQLFILLLIADDDIHAMPKREVSFLGERKI